jgi:nicotinate-nucleotide adenylyltransferase
MKIGIFGGTFDPPHIGHQILAAEALDQGNLDFVYWALTPDPPHKTTQKITSLSDRISMVELAIEGNPNFILSRVDIDRSAPYFAVDTVSILKSQAPHDDFFYLMGMDSLNDLLTWHMPADFVKRCKGIIVMYRRGESMDILRLEAEIPGLARKLKFLKTPTIEVSSTDIRERIRKGVQYRYLVPDKVNQFIINCKLYAS